METVYSFGIARLYDSVIRNQSWSSHARETSIYHHDCGLAFNAEFPEKWMFGYYRTFAEYYYCPKCGYHSTDKSKIACLHRVDDSVAMDMFFRVIRYKKWIDLEWRYQSVMVTENGICKDPLQHKRALRFNVANRKSYIINYEDDRSIQELRFDGPSSVMRPMIYDLGALADLKHNSYCNQYRSEFSQMCKVLRNEVSDLFKKLHGFRPSHMYLPLSMGASEGLLGDALLNIAWKLIFPDAPAINSDLRSLLANNQYKAETAVKASSIIYALRGDSFVDSIICANGFEPWPALRKYIGEAPHEAICLPVIKGITEDKNLVLKLLKHMANLVRNRHVVLSDESVQFFKFVSDEYQVQGLIKVLKEATLDGDARLDLRDSISILAKLKPDTLEEFKVNHPRLRDLHNELVLAFNKQKYGDSVIPAHNDLEWTIGSYAFVAPTNGLDLIMLGRMMHNCVGSYRERAEKGTTAIVAVYEYDKPVVCIEVDLTRQDGVVKQAKLNANQKVKEDRALNDMVKVWAVQHGLAIDTNDIRMEDAA